MNILHTHASDHEHYVIYKVLGVVFKGIQNNKKISRCLRLAASENCCHHTQYTQNACFKSSEVTELGRWLSGKENSYAGVGTWVQVPHTHTFIYTYTDKEFEDERKTPEKRENPNTPRGEFRPVKRKTVLDLNSSKTNYLALTLIGMDPYCLSLILIM